jgi:hypothetical protein
MAEIEDVASCLMNSIFDVHFPAMYGEGESAFYRLQIEIMAMSDDLPLFDWTDKLGLTRSLQSHRCRLQPSPVQP